MCMYVGVCECMCVCLCVKGVEKREKEKYLFSYYQCERHLSVKSKILDKKVS